ncbi:hypothetical protein ELAC_0150 [Estrella lausannensis]|uniref:Uncharacterized protein n=2 Tax=Estrella lausannensis TaxID=483423 RepID=A0A0H5DN49_9BACT|nr:hypothetical protein ELAC_0150 [Estrella lausannensis]
MANVYSPFIFHSSSTNSNKFACGTTARAIVQGNLFGQSRYQKIDSVKKLFRSLKDAEEGTFFLNIYGSEFVNEENKTAVFQGHAFTVLKAIEDGKTGYLLAQSYVEEYSLKDFLLNADRYYFDFSSLKEKVLRPFFSILNKRGPWTKKECRDFSSITSIYSERLIGFGPDSKVCPSGRLLEMANFGRTTDRAPGFEMRINYLSFLIIQTVRANNSNWKFDKIASIQSPISQALYHRYEAIDKKLKRLIFTDGMMVNLAKTYYKTVFNIDVEVIENDSKCQDVACAIVQANLFNHSYCQQLTFHELKSALRDSEEGTFMVQIYSDRFIDADNETKLFPGHSFVVIKVVEGQEIGYRFVHSFVGRLKLIDFLESKSHRYDDYGTLQEHILKPVHSLLKHKGPWGPKESQNFFLITSVYSESLEGYFPPSGGLAFDILRTTNRFKKKSRSLKEVTSRKSNH